MQASHCICDLWFVESSLTRRQLLVASFQHMRYVVHRVFARVHRATALCHVELLLMTSITLFIDASRQNGRDVVDKIEIVVVSDERLSV